MSSSGAKYVSHDFTSPVPWVTVSSPPALLPIILRLIDHFSIWSPWRRLRVRALVAYEWRLSTLHRPASSEQRNAATAIGQSRLVESSRLDLAEQTPLLSIRAVRTPTRIEVARAAQRLSRMHQASARLYQLDKA